MSELFNFDYYHNCCGPIPYESDPHFPSFFQGIAQKIVDDLHPKTVLDAGCAMGYLVAALRDLGVEAYGVDISEYAISKVREDVRPYCAVGSLTEPLPEPLPRHFDLVVSIEVLEHMYAEEGKTAIKNLCALSDRIIFSSSPEDFTEHTHFNVQQREYWARQFADVGFYDNVNYRPDYITAWAMCFVKSDNWLRQIEDYERQIRLHRGENAQLTAQLSAAQGEHEQLKAQLGAAQGENEQLTAQLGAARDENEQLTAQLSGMQGEKEQLNTQLSAAQGANEQLKAQLDGMKGENDRMKDQADNIREENERLRKQLDSAQGENEQLKSQLAQAKYDYEVISNAFFWKVTKPFRATLDFLKGNHKAVPPIESSPTSEIISEPAAELEKIAEPAFMPGSAYTIQEVNVMTPRKAQNSWDLRLNLVIPAVTVEHTFGGVATALRFFKELREEIGCASRIIITEAPISSGTLEGFDDYTLVDASEDVDAPMQMVEMILFDRHLKSIPVGAFDIFVATAWWTAYPIADVIRWQMKTYHKDKLPLVYFVQDFEPALYPWSSRYALADSTYHFEFPTYAIFSSPLLREYFNIRNYKFAKEWHFDPILNRTLRRFLPTSSGFVHKKKQILIYGRPTLATRNAFEVVVAALRIWCSRAEDAHEWTILSAGEAHEDVDLGNGMRLHSVGKLTLEEYAKTMLETYAGISLMISPHQSYPPLEMSTFGAKTITNCFENKDISDFNQNIVCLKTCAPLEVANALERICGRYDGKGYIDIESDYINKDREFNDIPQKVAEIIKRKEWERDS